MIYDPYTHIRELLDDLEEKEKNSGHRVDEELVSIIEHLYKAHTILDETIVESD